RAGCSPAPPSRGSRVRAGICPLHHHANDPPHFRPSSFARARFGLVVHAGSASRPPMTNERDDRRAFLAIAGAGVLLAACRKDENAEHLPLRGASSAATSSAQPGKDDEDVSATEDLMREHG